MPQVTDIELAGAGYVVAPGSYKRTQDGAPEGRTGRVAVRDFFGGQRRALQLERDKAWDALGVGPAYEGQGVEPWPAETVHADTALVGLPNASSRTPSLIVGSYAYVAVGRRLWRTVTLGTGVWANLTQVADVGGGNTIAGLVYYRGDILLLCGSALDIKRYNTATATLTDPWMVGERAKLGIAYAGQLVSCPGGPGEEDKLKLTVTKHDGTTIVDSRRLDSPIVQMGLFAGKAAIATRTGIYLLGGKPDPGAPDDPNVAGDQSEPTRWVGEPEPFFSHGFWTADDDFAFLLGYRGKLYTWLGNHVAEWNPGAGSQGTQGAPGGWRKVGPEGASCFGGCVAGGCLVVAVTTRDGDTETWAFDGSGWWLIHRAAAGNPVRVWPTPTGGAGGHDLLLFRAGAATYDLYRLVWRGAALQTYRSSAEWKSSLLDGGERDKPKAWRQVGAVFATPEARGNQSSTDGVTLTLDYSIDGGATWTTAASETVADPTRRTATLEATLANRAVFTSVGPGCGSRSARTSRRHRPP